MYATAIAELRALLGERLSTADALRQQFGHGEAYPQVQPPHAVAFAMSTAETAAIAQICHRHDMPMVASGACTSLEGHINATHGGLAINFARMDQVLAVNATDLDCQVQAGVTREQLNAYLRDTGLFFPIDPGANATLGGMAATRASGTNAVRYGTMAQNVLGLTVVQPDGTVIHSGGRARKSSAGYDLTRLYVGSEGTLGLITEVRLRLYGIPEVIAAATCAFDTLEGAVETVTQSIQLGIALARVEFLDEVQIRACNRYSKLALPDKPHLFFEFHGSPAATREQAEQVAAIAAAAGGQQFEWASDEAERQRLWKARHNAYHAVVALRPNATVWSSDVCVPVSQLVAAVLAVRRDIDQHHLMAPIVGHVGDGNFHVIFVTDANNAAEVAATQAVYHRMVEHAIAVGGTCTGEHGIGLVKRDYLLQEAGTAAVATMRSIKSMLDPKQLMNPGKIFN